MRLQPLTAHPDQAPSQIPYSRAVRSFSRQLTRLKWINREVIAFAVIGAINTVVDFGLFLALISLGPLKANVVSTIIATTTSYLMNRRWTYRDRAKTAVHREYVLFFGFNLVGLAIQEAILGIAKYGLGFHEDSDSIALLGFKCLGVAIAMVFRFWAYRTFVFKAVTNAEFAELTDPLDAELSAIATLQDIAEETPANAADRTG